MKKLIPAAFVAALLLITGIYLEATGQDAKLPQVIAMGIILVALVAIFTKEFVNNKTDSKL